MHSIDCQIYSTSKTSYILPSGANIINEGELLSAGTGSMDYGGGTKENSFTYISTLEGRPAVVIEGQAIITPQLITITPEEFLNASNFCPIDYTGIPLSYGFEGFAAWASMDMKFGRERDSYSASFDGVEFDITPYQLLYYSAKEVVILAENSSEPLLSDTQPISVLPPDNESGVWSAFLRAMTKDDYVALAENIRDQIELTGRAPGNIDSPIGALRAKDVLFTFLRIISFYCDRGELPDNITFVPSPADNLIRDGVEIPASNAYFLLSTQYVITGTPRVNQIVSDMRQVIHDNNELAENLCGWVYQNITYPMPPPLGWFTSEEILDTREGKCLDKANLYLALTRTAGIPSRLVSGFLIFEHVTEPFIEVAGMTPDGRYIVGHAWAEVYLPPNGWVFADPTGNYFWTSPYEDKIYSSVEETWQDVLASYEGTYGELI
jgi:transglutaminase-like putative cysteine protease